MISVKADTDVMSIQVPDSILQDLQARLKMIRWPDQIEGAGWDYGTNLDYLQELCAYWVDQFDWREQEAWLNSFPHFKTRVDGLGLHYIHQRSSNPDAIPLLLLHGWPSSFIQMLKILPLLTEPDANGLAGAPSFHVVIASLPGYGFSDAATAPGMAMESIASMMTKLMTEKLGYGRFAVRGSDLGGTIIDQIARHHGNHLLGAHLSGIIVAGPVSAPENASEAEKAFLQASAAMGMAELSYARQHATKPQTLAYGLNDSPAGLAGWIVEKFRSWGDTGGDIESRFSKEFLLTTLSTYWITQSINSSIRLYYEMVRNRGSMVKIDTPTGFMMSQKDMFPPAPREWAERSYNIVHWTETEAGGHFLEWEEPVLVAADIQAFFTTVQHSTEGGCDE